MLKYKKFITYVLFISLFVVTSILTVQSAKAVGTTQYLSGQSLSTNFGLTNFYDANYGVTVDAQGNLTGYAWNAYAGWLKFGGLSGFPSQSGTTASNAKIVPGAGNGPDKLVGWARFCSPIPGGLSGCMPGENTASNGGWSGWISFDSPTYGVTIGAETPLGSGNFPLSGYAWGSDDNGGSIGFGWMDMSPVKLTGTPTPPPSFRLYGGSPSDGIPQTATNTSSNDFYMTVNIGSTVKLTWNTNSIQTPNKCTASTTPASGSFTQGWVGAKASNDMTSVTGGHNTESVKTLTVPGTYTYKLDCLPLFGQPLNTQKVIVTVSATPVATLSLTGNPLTVLDTNPKTTLTYTKLGSGTGGAGGGGGSAVFTSCVGAAANSMGLPYTTAQMPNWVGARLVPNPTIVVPNVDVPLAPPLNKVWYSISCTTSTGQVLNPPPVIVERVVAGTPLLNLTFDDGSTNRYYPENTSTVDVIWDTPSGTTFSSCKGIGGLSDWNNISQGASMPGSETNNVNGTAGSSTTYQLECIDADTGNTVTSNTITAQILPTILNPDVDIKANIGTGYSDGPVIFPTISGGNVTLQWTTNDILSSQCQMRYTYKDSDGNNQQTGPYNVSSTTLSTESHNIITSTTYRIDCPDPTGVSAYISDIVEVKVPGTLDPNPPAGPKIPVFIEH